MPKGEWWFNSMKSRHTSSRRAFSQRGQTFLVVVVFVAVFLLAVMGLATDYAQIWAHRQMAQGAADAACQAGAADVYLKAVDPSAQSAYGLDFSWVGSSFDCSTKPNSAPCKYASLNGYSGSNVAVSFPSTLTGVPAIPPGFGTVANPYIQVKITDPVALTFTKLVSSTGSFNISASAGCGLNPVAVPIPLVVLHQTASGALSVSGAASTKIFGGPKRSIQVNSNSTSAVSVGTVDLSQAGPSGTGADFAVFGGPATKPSAVNLGSSGNWISPASPVGDPWVTLPTPTAPATAGTATPVPFAMNGCPDPAGCVEFTGGNYTSCSTGTIPPGGNGCLMFPYSGSNPKFSAGGNNWLVNHNYSAGTLILPTSNNAGSYVYQALNTGNSATSGTGPNPWNQTIGGNQVDNTITWKNVGVVSKNPNTAIFDPGLYYVGANGLNLGSNSTVRMSTANGDGNSGVTFYFSTSATVFVGSNSGKASACTSASSGSATPSNCVVSYKISGTASTAATGSILSRPLQCPAAGSPPNPTQVPSLIDGNILLGPCSGTYGDPNGWNRAFLFFQNRSTAANASWGGGGQFLLSGFMYFHSGSGATCGTNTTCLTMSGGSGAGAYALGNIVVDKISMTGNSGLNMILNPTVTFQVLRPQMLQ